MYRAQKLAKIFNAFNPRWLFPFPLMGRNACHWRDVTRNVANTENMEIFNYTAIPTYSLNIMELVKTLGNTLLLWLSPLSALSGLLLLLMLL